VLILYITKWPARLAKVHEAQLVNYLVATGKEVGLLLNFGEQKVEVKRKVKDLDKQYQTG
jgi:GxxExxY protein